MQLLVQSGPDAGKVFPLQTSPQVAGRQLGADILLTDEQVSRRHVSFQEVNGSLLLTDLGSANGTLLNGNRLNQNQPQTIFPGDQVKIGSTVLVVQGQPIEAYNQPPAWTGNPTPFYPVTPVPPSAPMPPAAPVYQPGASFEPAPGYNQASLAPNQNLPAAVPGSYNSYGVAPAPPRTAANKNRGGLFAGLGAIVVLAIAAIAGIIFISGNNNPAPTSQPAGISTTAAARTPVTNPVGPSGTNLPPPSPPVGLRPPELPTANSVSRLAQLNPLSRSRLNLSNEI